MTLTVSDGPGQGVVPDVEGPDAGRGAQALKKRRASATSVEPEHSGTVADGQS